MAIVATHLGLSVLWKLSLSEQVPLLATIRTLEIYSINSIILYFTTINHSFKTTGD